MLHPVVTVTLESPTFSSGEFIIENEKTNDWEKERNVEKIAELWRSTGKITVATKLTVTESQC
jgi:hypothetical protein